MYLLLKWYFTENIDPKDKIEKGKQNNIVYKIPCADCNAVYIGESKRSFDQRSKEHVRAVKNGDVDKNEIADHSWKLDHKFDWENKIIIDREQNWRVRKIKETIHSISDKNHINTLLALITPALGQRRPILRRPLFRPEQILTYRHLGPLLTPR